MLTFVSLGLLTLAPQQTTSLTAVEAELTLMGTFLPDEVTAAFGIFREHGDDEELVAVEGFDDVLLPGTLSEANATAPKRTLLGKSPDDVWQDTSPDNNDGSDDDEQARSRGGTAVSILGRTFTRHYALEPRQ